jgi:hypothetical protein
MQLVGFVGQCCVFIALVGRDVLIIVAELGILDGRETDSDTGWFLNHSTMKFDDGLDPTGMYFHDDD